MLQYSTASVLGSVLGGSSVTWFSQRRSKRDSKSCQGNTLSKVQATFNLSMQEPLDIFASDTHGSHISGTSCESSEK